MGKFSDLGKFATTLGSYAFTQQAKNINGSGCFWLFSNHPEYVENEKQPETTGTREITARRQPPPGLAIRNSLASLGNRFRVSGKPGNRRFSSYRTFRWQRE